MAPYYDLPVFKDVYKDIQIQNLIAQDHKTTKQDQVTLQSSMNSYLGIIKHYNTINLGKKLICYNLSSNWWNDVYISGRYSKCIQGIRRSTASNNM